MTLEEQKLVSAMTPTTGYKTYPPYINVKRSGDYGRMVTVTLRGNELTGAPGDHAQAEFSREDFALFLLETIKSL